MLLVIQDQDSSNIEKPRFYGAFLLYLQLNLYPVKSIIVKEIESKSIVWFEPSNQYLVVEPITARIINDISEKKELQTVASELENDLDIPYEKAIDFIIDLEEKLVKPNMDIEKGTYSNKTNFSRPETFEYTKYYSINSKTFKIEYSTEFEVSLIHPKFAHLETKVLDTFDQSFQIFNHRNHICFVINDELIDSWSQKEIHYFQGKVSMKIIENIYDKLEEQWMGVFHASALSHQDNSILLLGDSGNGKSTSLALLKAHGFNCVADDFVPIDNQQKVYAFPAGISIKKTAVNHLLRHYPELASTAEYYYERLGKTVRYIPQTDINYDATFPCKALVYIKYDPTVEFEIKKISNVFAFESLVPDSWISQKPENVRVFLDWFSSLPCYQLTYSNNEKMINEIGQLLKNDE